MKLKDAMTRIKKCDIPILKDYSTLRKIDSEEFYYPSPLNDIRTDGNEKVLLFSAPGAVGKTSLAKHIAYEFGGLYWDVSKSTLSRTAFAGEIVHGVGVGNGSKQDKLYEDLKKGNCLIVLDAFDEAVQKSSRDDIKDFLNEISEQLKDAQAPSVVMMARTGMASFIHDTLGENGISFSYYSIDYFQESESVDFICEYLHSKGITVTQRQQNNIESYINRIKQRLGSQNDPKTFVGYAQVLIILARQIEVEITTDAKLDKLVEKTSRYNDEHLIFSIIQELIKREQSKLSEFKEGLREKYKVAGKEEVIDSLYCKEEQLIRLQFYVDAGSIESISIDDYPESCGLFPDDYERYLEVLKNWIPEHVFLSNHKIMPVFEDYLLAESLINDDLNLFTELYQTRLPTRVFMDCYLCLNSGNVNSEHIYFLDLAFSSQERINRTTYCEISALDEEDSGQDNEKAGLSLYLIMYDESAREEQSLLIRIIRKSDDPIRLCRAENMSVCVDGKVILSNNFLKDVTIRQSSIECDELILDAPEIFFETYGDEQNQVIVHKNISRKSGGKIVLKGTKNLQVELPEEKNEEYKKQFYEFAHYLCTISTDINDLTNCDSIEQFTFGLKKVLEQFKVDKYEGDPAKFREKIDARCHTGCKARVLGFLKHQGLIYEDGLMYKASLSKMDQLRISRVAYTHFDYQQLQYVYGLYTEYFTSFCQEE